MLVSEGNAVGGSCVVARWDRRQTAVQPAALCQRDRVEAVDDLITNSLRQASCFSLIAIHRSLSIYQDMLYCGLAVRLSLLHRYLAGCTGHQQDHLPQSLLGVSNNLYVGYGLAFGYDTVYYGHSVHRSLCPGAASPWGIAAGGCDCGCCLELRGLWGVRVSLCSFLALSITQFQQLQACLVSPQPDNAAIVCHLLCCCILHVPRNGAC